MMMVQKKSKPVLPETGQEPITTFALCWLIVLVILWAANSVFVKIAVRDIPPFWAAFLRFGPALPFITAFIAFNGSGFSLGVNEFFKVVLLAVMMVFQIYTFNLGALYTTAGRVTLFIFSYPLFVSLIAPLFLKEERFLARNLIGGVIALAGLLIALGKSLSADTTATLKGDLIELISCLTLSVSVVYLKRLTGSIDKWRIIFWEFMVAVALFLWGALFFETFDVRRVQTDAWASLLFQSLAVSVFCFMSWQYLIARHNSSSISVFFFLTPIIGMLIGVLMLKEPFDPALLSGCLLVGAGIYIVNRSP